jgi:restriction endonuclease S subunit
MSSEWLAQKLSALGEFDRGKSKHRPRDAAHLYGGAYPFIQTGDVTNSDGRITSFRQTYSDAGLAQSRLWPTGTLAITIAANIAETALLTFPACFPDSVVGFVADPKKADVRFVEYLFRAMRKQVKSHAYGSAQENINLDVLRKLQFLIPPLNLQITIADCLSLLDDRIALLRETNATLEAIAQALFKSWFVDFDPVRAKQQGLAPAGMDEATAALFPDSFEESALGLVPRGWPPCTFRGSVAMIGGGTPKTSVAEYWGGDIPWYSVVDAPSPTDVFVVDTEKHITQAGLQGSSTKLLPAGTTIISARGTVGKLALAGREMAMNQSCYGLRGKAGDDYFTYFSTSRLVEQLKQRAHGSVFDTITQATFDGVHLSYPTQGAIAAYDAQVAPSMLRIRENLIQGQTVASLRDTLLPRLISGQLRLPEALAELEEAA